QMKATGEAMAIEKSIPAALQKAIRSLELDEDDLNLVHLSTDRLKDLIVHTDDRRFFALLELMRRGLSLDELHNKTEINMYFLQEISKIIELERLAEKVSLDTVTKEELLSLKQGGFTDEALAVVWKVAVKDVVQKREQFKVRPHFERIDAVVINSKEEES